MHIPLLIDGLIALLALVFILAARAIAKETNILGYENEQMASPVIAKMVLWFLASLILIFRISTRFGDYLDYLHIAFNLISSTPIFSSLGAVLIVFSAWLVNPFSFRASWILSILGALILIVAIVSNWQQVTSMIFPF